MNVYTDIWIKEFMDEAMERLIVSHKDIIGIIFNRFRIFLNFKRMGLSSDAFYYGCNSCRERIGLAQYLKIHLYNHRDTKTQVHMEVPKDPNHKMFRLLTRKYRFKWDDVGDTINEMDDIGIDFNADLCTMKTQLLTKKANEFMTLRLYKKLIKRLNVLIDIRDSRWETGSDSLDEIFGSDESIISSDTFEKTSSDDY